MRSPERFTLQGAVTKTASDSFAPVDRHLAWHEELVITLQISAADLTDLDETYDFYITTENEAGARWDLAHFAQIVADDTYTLVARVRTYLLPRQVSTASPGVEAVESGTLAVAAGQANRPTTLTAGVVRHGSWGNKIGYELVTGGTTPSVSYSITVEAR